jgi:hypothetical protein
VGDPPRSHFGCSRLTSLLAAGNAEIYRRDDVVCRPVTGLTSSQLAVLWRTGDNRKAIQVFTGVFCQCVQADG